MDATILNEELAASSCDVRRGPRGFPLLGHAASLSFGRLEFLRACAARYGDLIPLRFFGKPILLVNHPDDVRQVLLINHQRVVKGMAHRTDRLLVRDGLSLSEGEDWRRDRRTMQPAFHRERLAEHGVVAVAWAERTLATWREGETRALDADLSQLALAIVVETFLGVDLRDEPDLAQALSSALTLRDDRATSPEVFLPDVLPTPLNLRLRRARRRIDRLLNRILHARRRLPDDRDDLLSVLSRIQGEDGRPRTDGQVRDELVSVVVGGTETVANLLAWTFYLLSQHPDVDARLGSELDGVLDGRSPTVTDRPRLRYTESIVSEVLRLYPPAAVLEREAIADFDLSGYRVARGTDVLISPWVLHRDPRYFADPDRFDPDRWTGEAARQRPPYAYLPFGGGARRCIGMPFALLEATLILATVARRFRLELRPGHPVVAEPIPTLRPKYGLRMIVRGRRSKGEDR